MGRRSTILDENSRAALFGVSSVDDESIVVVAVNPDNGHVLTEAVVTKTAIALDAARDESIKELTEQIKIMNLHLSRITGEQFIEEDIEGEVNI